MKNQLPYFTLEEAEREILRLEKMASTTRDLNEATRIIFFNFITAITRSGLLNA